MMKLDCEFNSNKYNLELFELNDYYSKVEVLAAIEKEEDELKYTIIEMALKEIDSSIDVSHFIFSSERGEERNLVSPYSEAKRLGFTKLIANIYNVEVIVFE